MNNSYPSQLEIEIDLIIKYCRELERRKDAGESEEGGADVLKELLNNNKLPKSMHDTLEYVVKNYNLPYDIKTNIINEQPR